MTGVSHLLVASDFDGTLVPFANDPAAVVANPDALTALTRLAGFPQVTVAIVSGRSLVSLREVIPAGSPYLLVGSHGAETSDQPLVLDDAQSQALSAVDAALTDLCTDGAWVEVKPLQRVFHVRPVTDSALQKSKLARATAIGNQLMDKHHGLRLIPGNLVVEFSVSTVTKGTWINRYRSAHPGCTVVYAGDDTTDESVFTVLKPNDVGIKVGPGETAATVRVAGPEDLAATLTGLIDKFNLTR